MKKKMAGVYYLMEKQAKDGRLQKEIIFLKKAGQ
jgi:hypothetical protein